MLQQVAQTKQVLSRPLEKFKSLCVALAQRGEAGSASREQSCCSWCVELALPHLTACAAAAVLTAVLARAESFTLVVAGHEIELSGRLQLFDLELPILLHDGAA